MLRNLQPRRIRIVEDAIPIDVLNELFPESESIHVRDGSIRMGGEIIGYIDDVNPKKETPDR
jgi:hypothetical protein